jgi:hypothetical protein
MSGPRAIDPDAPMCAPSRSLPGHKYLPGRTERPEERVLPIAPGPPGATEPFRHGVDLYNHAFFWEAHEAWEQLWHACPEGADRLALQGLIQVAAALLKEHLEVPSGAIRLARTGTEKLLEAARRGSSLPLDLNAFALATRRHFAPLEDPQAPAAPPPGLRLRP